MTPLPAPPATVTVHSTAAGVDAQVTADSSNQQTQVVIVANIETGMAYVPEAVIQFVLKVGTHILCLSSYLAPRAASETRVHMGFCLQSYSGAGSCYAAKVLSISAVLSRVQMLWSACWLCCCAFSSCYCFWLLFLQVFAPFMYSAVLKVLHSTFDDPTQALPQRLTKHHELYDMLRQRCQDYLDGHPQ